ncbi:acetyltransferase (GNAT) family protein [Kribbella sp. VKM Ac-2527]|uniref:Acetyltransferase (GNAT) family protein n=1 Tax=Kribbella caucasensis TaxID=2512215 RepID=A0A4R6KE96_9ACTN|nr:GNAT family N-acetyltransferase [Kribbella sp. VKM Ac-2527]TDO47373.1 acetyltransferase (GNAT) family protein [Kribbella sp. VKM Ac-2527]
MEIVGVDGLDAAQFERFFRLRDEVRRAEQEFPAGLGLEEARVLFTGDHTDTRSDGLGLVDGDEWLGMAWLDWWLLENTDVVDVELAVSPQYRRRGVGTRLLEAVKERALAEGRRRFTTTVVADAASGESSGTAFAEAHGFVRKHTELHQVLELPLGDAAIDALDRVVDGYKIVQWREHTPDEWVGEMADALSAMSRDVPRGELDVELQRWTPERVRETEARRIAQGRFCHTTVAVDGDGRLAAYTQMGGATKDPSRLYQFDTFVRPEHRGNRLGMAVKVPNLRSLQAGLDRPSVLHTWNAPENAPMIAVNEHLGFRPVDQRVNLQLDL